MNTQLHTSDRLTLEARWDLPPREPKASVVLAHPHPLMGGSMDAPLIRTVAGHLRDAGVAVLRFNFRGVGSSEGKWSGGAAEIEDLAAAVEACDAAYPGLPQGLAGWSFGAFTALRWQARADDGRSYGGIAPPVRMTGGLTLPAPAALPPGPRLFVVGDRDQFTTVDELGAYAGAADASFEVVAGADHFFHFRDRQVAALLADHLAPDTGS